MILKKKPKNTINPEWHVENFNTFTPNYPGIAAHLNFFHINFNNKNA
jgi:hypothetical protein